MKRYRTDLVVLWMHPRSILRHSYQRIIGVPHATEVLRHEVRQFKFHRRTIQAPDFR